MKLRAQAAHAEATAEAAEDFARLTPRQRSARRVARLLMAAQPDGLVDKADTEAVPLTVIMDKLGISLSTASEIRKEAMSLLQSGYGPQEGMADAAYEPIGRE